MNVTSYCTKYYFVSDVKNCNTLNNIEAPLKDVLFDLRARNFVRAITSSFARCAHARQRARNLLSPVTSIIYAIQIFHAFLLTVKSCSSVVSNIQQCATKKKCPVVDPVGVNYFNIGLK